MISLRYHLVSITAVFLALAVGVVLGSTSGSQRLLSLVAGDRESLTQQIDQLKAERAELAAQERAADRFVGSVAPTVVANQLNQRRVVLVLAPDANGADRDAVRQLITEAGGVVTGEVTLTDAVLDPARAEQARELATRLLPAGAQLPVSADSGGLIGGLLGSVLLENPRGGPRIVPDQAVAALTGLSAAGMLRPGPTPAPAQLALVIAGGAATSADGADRAATLARLAGELDRSGAGAVLAGRSGVEKATGAVGVARADPTSSNALSTVDNVQTTVGRVASVLALREQADGNAGRYGASASAQTPIPGPATG